MSREMEEVAKLDAMHLAALFEPTLMNVRKSAREAAENELLYGSDYRSDERDDPDWEERLDAQEEIEMKRMIENLGAFMLTLLRHKHKDRDDD